MKDDIRYYQHLYHSECEKRMKEAEQQHLAHNILSDRSSILRRLHNLLTTHHSLSDDEREQASWRYKHG